MQGVFFATIVGLESIRGSDREIIFSLAGLRRTDIRLMAGVGGRLEGMINLRCLLVLSLSVQTPIDFGAESLTSQWSRFARFRWLDLLMKWAAALTSPWHLTSAFKTTSMSGTGGVSRLDTRAKSVSVSLSFMKE